MKIISLFVLFSLSLSTYARSYTVPPGKSLMTISFKFYGTHQCWKIIQKANPSLGTNDSIEEGSFLQIPEFSNCTHPNREKKAWDLITNSVTPEQTSARIPSIPKMKKNIIKITPPKQEIKADRTSTSIKDKFVLYNSGGKSFRNNPELKDKALIKVHKSSKKFTIQVGAFKTKKEAIYNKKKLQLLGTTPYIEIAMVKARKWYRLRIGSFPTVLQAKEYARKKKIKRFTNSNYLLMEL